MYEIMCFFVSGSVLILLTHNILLVCFRFKFDTWSFLLASYEYYYVLMFTLEYTDIF